MGMGGRFQWVQPAIYPLFAVVAVGGVVALYSSWRHLWTNPEVFPSRSYRQEGVPETEEARLRAKGYEDSIFRSLQEGRRAQGAERPDTRIFGGK
ncbi:hypothetical protein ABPG75_010536 [Micractinium tetrahymenae]